LGDRCTAAVIHTPAAAAAAAAASVGHLDVKQLPTESGWLGLLNSCSNAGLMTYWPQAQLGYPVPGSS
jgi:hypothetical protein